MNYDSSSEYISAAGRATPPIAVSGLLVAGASLQDWVCIVTIAYTVIQIFLLVYKAMHKDKP